MLLLCAISAGAGCDAAPPPNVVLYVVDTLRADALAAYGSRETRTPHIDRLAREGRVYTCVFAPSSWTRSTVGTLLTGLPPDVHGAVRRRDVLPEALTLLSERFAERGYATAAVVGNPNVGRVYGFDQGWDAFIEAFQAGPLPSIDVVNAHALEWIDRAERPFFLFVLAVDPHYPYLPPAAFDRHDPATNGPFARQRARYLGEVEQTDAGLGAFMPALRTRGELDRTILVVTADHGEEFGEHGQRGHGKTLYREVLHVPLVIRHPARVRPGVEPCTPSSSIAVPHMLLALSGDSGTGRTSPVHPSLAPTDSEGDRDATGEPLVARIRIDGHAQSSLRSGRWKLIEDTGKGTVQLYDLAADPTEEIDVARSHPERVARMRGRLARILRERRERRESTARAVPDAQLPDATRRSLEALGYVDPAPADEAR